MWIQGSRIQPECILSCTLVGDDWRKTLLILLFLFKSTKSSCTTTKKDLPSIDYAENTNSMWLKRHLRGDIALMKDFLRSFERVFGRVASDYCRPPLCLRPLSYWPLAVFTSHSHTSRRCLCGTYYVFPKLITSIEWRRVGGWGIGLRDRYGERTGQEENRRRMGRG